MSVLTRSASDRAKRASWRNAFRIYPQFQQHQAPTLHIEEAPASAPAEADIIRQCAEAHAKIITALATEILRQEQVASVNECAELLIAFYRYLNRNYETGPAPIKVYFADVHHAAGERALTLLGQLPHHLNVGLRVDYFMALYDELQKMVNTYAAAGGIINHL